MENPLPFHHQQYLCFVIGAGFAAVTTFFDTEHAFRFGAFGGVTGAGFGVSRYGRWRFGRVGPFVVVVIISCHRALFFYEFKS